MKTTLALLLLAGAVTLVPCFNSIPWYVSGLHHFFAQFNSIRRARQLESGSNPYMNIAVDNNNLKTPTLAQAKYYIHIAAAAYCNDPQLSGWKCKDCLATGETTKLFKVIEEPTWRDRAIVAINDKRKEIILGFRGSINMRNFRQDLRAELVTVAIAGHHGEIRVHRGVWDGATLLYPEITSAIRVIGTKHPDYSITLVGHSLGGMLAMLSFFKLKTSSEFSNRTYSVYTYGAARVGNLEYALWYNSQNITSIRVVANGDRIPHAALRANGYVHPLRELWLNRGKDKFCAEDKLEDPSCSNSLGTSRRVTIRDHLFYWDRVFPPLDCLTGNPVSYISNFL